jgi:hypothetical protein
MGFQLPGSIFPETSSSQPTFTQQPTLKLALVYQTPKDGGPRCGNPLRTICACFSLSMLRQLEAIAFEPFALSLLIICARIQIHHSVAKTLGHCIDYLSQARDQRHSQLPARR